MKRREFVKGIVSTASLVSVAGLTACHDDEPPYINPLPNNQLDPSDLPYGMGLSYATPAMLATTMVADEKQLINFSSSSNNTNLAPTQLKEDLPSYFNLADAQLMAEYGWPIKLPPVASQGKLGSCTAWGVGYAAGTFLNALQNITGTPNSNYLYVSPADLYAKLLKAQAYNCGSGTPIKVALDIMVKDGVSSLFNLPYSDAVCYNPSYKPEYFIDGYYRIKPDNLLAIQAALNNFLVLPFGMKVYKDFHTFKGSGVYKYSLVSSGAYVGGHCMALVGYDNNRQAFKVMNSWGKNWGDQGFVWIDYQTFIALVAEVFVPIKLKEETASTFIKTSSAVSGSVSVDSSYITSMWDGSINQRTLISTIKLNSPMRLRTYRILFVYPNGSYITLDEKNIDCFIRSFKFFSQLSDDTFLKTYLQNKQGWFAIQLIGTSTYSENVSLLAYNSFA